MRESTGGATAVEPRRPGGRGVGCALQGLGCAALVVALSLAAIFGLPLVIGAATRAGFDAAVEPLRKIQSWADGEDVDTTGPAVLKGIDELPRLQPVSGYFEVVVVRTDDQGGLPDWFDGERVIYVGKGDVDATIDMSGLKGERVQVSEDGRSATLRLPQPVLQEPRLDLEKSEFVVAEKGWTDRLKNSTLKEESQKEAVQKIREAAVAAELVPRARESATQTLTSFLTSLGYEDVTVTFDPA